MEKNNNIDPVLSEYINQVLPFASSRAQYVINTIIKQGFITSEDIRNMGYVHGARAIGDVRDNGIPLITLRIKSTDGRTIAKYIFGNSADIKRHKFGGRINFPSTLKQQLILENGLICGISKQELPENELQIDHRIPFYISGDISGERKTEDFMLLSKSMQRSKSWACEHCENILIHFDAEICRKCYWSYPDNYEHIAMKKERRIDLVFSEHETLIFDAVKTQANKSRITMQETIKSIIKKYFL